MNTISSLGDVATFNAIVSRTITSFEDDQLTNVGAYTFRGCTSLQSINLPNVTEIGAFAFYGCNGLNSVSLPSVVTIKSQAFANCNNNQFTSIYLPSVETIANNVFSSCSYLVTIELPVIESIGDSAFSSCTRLTTIIIRNTDGVVPIGNNLLTSSSNALIYVPDALVNDYKAAANWVTYFNRIKGLNDLPNS